MLDKDLELIVKELKELNYDVYLCSTFALRDDFRKIAAISLLHEELKKVSEIASEDLVGMIRLAWWKENLEDVFLHNRNKDHHLLNTISAFKNEIDFSKLEVAFEGFNLDFSESKFFQNKEELQSYILKTYGVFFEIILEILQIKDKNLSNNLASINFYFDLLKKIKKQDEKVVRFFYPDFFSELKIDAKFWQKNNSDKNYEENLKLIVKYIVSEIEKLSNEIKLCETNLSKRSKNITLRKDLILLLIKELKQRDFDVLSSNLSARKILVLWKLLLKFISK